MQKDRFIFALIIYGIVLLAGAGVCSFLLPGDASAVVNSGIESEANSPKDVVEPTQTPEQVKKPESDANVPEKNESVIQNGEESEGQDVAEDDRDAVEKGVWALLSVDTTAEWRETIGERCIVLPKPDAVSEEREVLFSLTDMPVEHSIALKFQGCVQSEYAYENIERIANGKYYAGEPSEESSIAGSEEETDADPLSRMTQLCVAWENDSYELNIEFLLDKAYVYNVYETESHYFIALREAKDVYDRIVVLDAGHGGWDTGTPSHDGKYLEKNINLQVLLYLEELLKADGIQVYSTRTTDRSIGHTERIGLANALGADMFISIHCNNAYQNPEANGTEVLYTQYQGEGGLNSHMLSQFCLEELVTALQLNNRGLFARGDDLTVLQKAEVPATLVELAFMSNTGDMAVLKTEEAQKAAAEALHRAIIRAYDAMAEGGEV